MRDFVLHFDLRACGELDEYALLACQQYNFGDKSSWFGEFRGGLFGLYHRVDAVRRHYAAVHAWIPLPRTADAEYNLSAILFNMDSAIECFTFALNALGNSAFAGAFRDITDSRELRHISPLDITGGPNQSPPMSGYLKYFPRVQELWSGSRDLLQIIKDCHDVSKHRSVIFSGGQCRMDAPPGFYEALGIHEDALAQSQFWPMQEIILARNVKSPYVERYPTPPEDQILLEDTAERFTVFINETARLALEDTKVAFVLPVPRFRDAGSAAQADAPLEGQRPEVSRDS